MYPKMWEAIGPALPGAPRSPDPARDRAARRETAAAHERDRRIIDETDVAPHRSRRWRARRRPGDLTRRGRGTWRRRPARGLTGGAQVARAYDAIIDARFAEIPVAVWPRPARRRRPRSASCSKSWLTAGGRSSSIRTIAVATRRSRRRPTSPSTRSTGGRGGSRHAAEAWFYLGGAIGARAQWRVLRGQTLAAARDGKRIKEALERALVARSRAPGCLLRHRPVPLLRRRGARGCAKMLRWLLLLPGGDREQGLQEMLRARSGGQLLRSEADYQLHLVYLWYEKQTPRALELLSALAARHPHNPHFLQQIAEIEDGYTLNGMRPACARGRRCSSGRAPARWPIGRWRWHARELGVALELYHLGQPEAAIPHLRAVIDAEAARAGRRRGARAAATGLRLRPARAARCRRSPRTARRSRRIPPAIR